MAGSPWWLRPQGDPDDGPLPIKLGACSNGEVQAEPMGEVAREAARRARAEVAVAARRSGLTRREVLRSACGSAIVLLALAACSEEKGGGSTTGTFSLPPTSGTDPTVADSVLVSDVPILDVQQHLLDYEGLPASATSFGAGFPQARCRPGGDKACFSVEDWIDAVFARSDTTMAVLSALPIVDDAHPLSAEKMAFAQRVAERVCGDRRVLLQGQANPNVGRLGAALDLMDQLVERQRVVAWKVYTHAPGTPWSLTDPVGEAFLQRVEQLHRAGKGPDVVAVHKGLAGFSAAASPADVGPAAKRHPGIRFVVYHSGFETTATEGPYRPDGKGVDRLVRSLREAGVAAGSNVYAELGTTWRTVMREPEVAAHVLGKVLLAVGPGNVVWGTDSIWYGSPQDQIEAFRAFEITKEAQERFGYPALTPAVKAEILGANAARLHGIDLGSIARTCRPDPKVLAGARRELSLAVPDVLRGPRTADQVAAAAAAEHPWERA